MPGRGSGRAKQKPGQKPERTPNRNPARDLWYGRDTETAECRLAFCQGWRVLLTPRGSQIKTRILRKEVIQPQVPLRLPCYDFTPVADLTVDGYLL